MTAKVRFDGPARYWLRSSAALGRSVVEASVRRMLKGPRRPGWNWFMELGTEILRRQLAIAFQMRDVQEARRFLDSLCIGLRNSEISITPQVSENFRGDWFVRENLEPRATLFYFHGGGYSFYPKGYSRFISMITLAAKSKTFALDYRLSPEYRFPAQLEDALSAYRWLLENGTDPQNLVLAGDSAGANLALAVLLAVREANLPPPALAIALSPPTDFDVAHAGIEADPGADWIDRRMLEHWADWFCDSAQRRNPLVSQVRADLQGLPPIYIQAGRDEILYGAIQAFTDRARSQGADVMLESWEHMNHDFQMFAPYVPQSVEALRRLREVVDVHTCAREHSGIVPGPH